MASSGSDSAGNDAGMAEDVTSTWETMKSAGSMDFFSSRSFCGPGPFGRAGKYTLASSPPPMVFAARACSRATRTAERTCASCAHFSDASLSRPEARAWDSGNKEMWTLSGSPADFGKYFQISSEVKTRIGAMRRTRALVIFQTAVCAERRACARGGLAVEGLLSAAE